MKEKWVRVGTQKQLLRKLPQLKRGYKDEIFRIVFRNKKDLLQLYNAVNGTDYTNENELSVNTLEDAILIGVKNDLSFIIRHTLNMYEQQSTINPNMPLRGIIYFAELFSAYIQENELHIYGSKLIKLPLPQYVVFYNGTTEQPSKTELKLSDAFELQGKEGCLECKAIMININLGHNKDLLESCNKLKEYSQFVEIVRIHLASGKAKEVSISGAIEECITAGILADVLERNRYVIMNILSREYYEKYYWKLEHRALEERVREEVEEKVREEMQEKMQEVIKSIILDNLEEGVKKEQIINKLHRRYSIDEIEAKEYVEKMAGTEKE